MMNPPAAPPDDGGAPPVLQTAGAHDRDATPLRQAKAGPKGPVLVEKQLSFASRVLTNTTPSIRPLFIYTGFSWSRKLSRQRTSKSSLTMEVVCRQSTPCAGPRFNMANSTKYIASNLGTRRLAQLVQTFSTFNQTMWTARNEVLHSTDSETLANI